MSSRRDADEFKIDGIRQVTNRRFKKVEAPNGWTMRDRADTDLILQTLLSAL